MLACTKPTWTTILLLATFASSSKSNHLGCSLSGPVLQEIRSHRDIVDQIIYQVLHGPEKGKTYQELAKFADKFGSRMSGTENLENAINYMVDLLRCERLHNVHTEDALVPHWKRGNESATLIIPRTKNIALLGLGSSVGTRPEGITAEAIVVRSFDELKSRGIEVARKIVIYNQIFETYGESVKYRVKGAVEAAKLGAVASLIRSITPFSLYSPHTGQQEYEANLPMIPSACITVEDAEMFDRMTKRGEKIIINLKMGAQNFNAAMSRNTISEIRGSKYLEQFVITSGHLDSWDIGQGALDNGGGAFISWRALSVLQSLNIRPARTIRSILWTGEEQGLLGGKAYFENHREEFENLNIHIESDHGTFTPRGLTFSGKNKDAQCIVQEVLQLLDSINATELELSDSGSEVSIWINEGYLGATLITDAATYFYYHHTEADAMTVQNSDVLDLCTAMWAAVSYVFANLENMLPH